MKVDSPIILAVDTTEIDRANELVEQTRDYVSVYKFGLEFYLRHGLEALEVLKRDQGIRIFLDLKLHDIPNTVGKAASAVAQLDPFILTVHAAGGGEMIEAASQALPETLIAAVTVLTSLDGSSLQEMGLHGDVSALVSSLAKNALGAGARALVTSPHEVTALRESFPSAILITPGIRISEGSHDDQRRTMTPREAIERGSDYLVIGRPITGDPSPADAARKVLSSLE